MNLITLTTDFGARDWFVGTMKGVILGINPDAVIVDLCHEIPPGEVLAGALCLKAAACFFPPETIHVVVVDPSVGSRRRAIAVRTDRATFVGPDNGVLSLVLRNEEVREIRHLKNRRFFLEMVGRTFQGRDVFAPVAAHLSVGVCFERLGPLLRTFCRLRWPRPVQSKGTLRGKVVHIDRFGNALTNLPAPMLARHASSQAHAAAAGTDFGPVRRYYAEVAPGRPLALIGSTGLLELSVNRGSAAEQFGLRVGEPVQVGIRP